MTRIGLLRVGHIDPRSQHVGGDYLELYGAILQPHGIELIEFACDEGELPASLDDCAGWICSPSRSSVYDDEPWLPGVTELLLRVVAEERPFVGICFGHQLVAQALGGEVRQAGTGWGVGVQRYDLVETPRWMDQPHTPLALIASHQDQVVRLPAGAALLATNDECPFAGMLVGERAWTLQGHPEFTAELADSLLAGRIELIGAEKVAAARATLTRPADQARVASWMARFFAGVEA